MTLPRLPMDKAVRALLETVTGKPCGLGGFPPTTEPPYTVLYPQDALYSGPPFADDHADVEWVWQVTAVGRRTDQAQWMLDKARSALLDRGPDGIGYANDLTVPGMTVTYRRVDSGAPMDGEDGIVNAREVYAFTVTPT